MIAILSAMRLGLLTGTMYPFTPLITDSVIAP